jgi:Ribbon-helix-helix protein, copG family
LKQDGESCCATAAAGLKRHFANPLILSGLGTEGRLKAQSKAAVRASISFPPDLYEALEAIAKQKKVSLAWVVRDAAERYVADQKAKVGKQ